MAKLDETFHRIRLASLRKTVSATAEYAAYLKIATPNYLDYKRNYKGPGSPMTEEAWEAKVLGKGKKGEPKGEAKAKPKGEAKAKPKGEGPKWDLKTHNGKYMSSLSPERKKQIVDNVSTTQGVSNNRALEMISNSNAGPLYGYLSGGLASSVYDDFTMKFHYKGRKR